MVTCFWHVTVSEWYLKKAVMQKQLRRIGGRAHNELRPLSISYDVYGYALASVLLSVGNTKVLCSINIQHNVPPFLRGKKQGWLTAEYNMLPSATQVRTVRETSSASRNGRSVEISRLIGRSLRSVLDLSKLGEQTIVVDCDVLQADGGTRTACLTGAFLALELAVNRLHYMSEEDRKAIIKDRLVALSAGVRGDQVLLDIDCAEDTTIDADFNFVLTESDKIVEVQGTAEQHAIDWQLFQEMCTVARNGAQDLVNQLKQFPAPETKPTHGMSSEKRSPFFSLQNRVNNAS
jgi:ribonuclease PH